MIDLATRPQPNRSSAATLVGVPFDLRLVRPGPVVDYPYTDFTTTSGLPTDAVVQLATYSVELEDTLQTAIVLSLFTDRRAPADDRLPLNETDRRGWVGEEFMPRDAGPDVDAWGSTLWLLYAGKALPGVLELARFAAQEALAWLVRDGIADRVEVSAEWVGDRQERLAIRPRIYKPDQVRPVYDVLWGTTILRGPV